MLAGEFAGVSSDVWAVIGVAVAAIAIPVTVWSQFASARHRRTRLRWKSFGVAPLGQSEVPLLEMVYNGLALTDPHLVSIGLYCDGENDIPSTVFDQQEPLVFDLGAPIVAEIRAETGSLLIRTASLDTQILFEPFHFPRRTAIVVTYMVDGPPDVSLTASHLVDVDIAGPDSVGWRNRSILTIRPRALILTTLAAFALIAYARSSPMGVNETVLKVLQPLSLISLFAILSIWGAVVAALRSAFNLPGWLQ